VRWILVLYPMAIAARVSITSIVGTLFRAACLKGSECAWARFIKGLDRYRVLSVWRIYLVHEPCSSDNGMGTVNEGLSRSCETVPRHPFSGMGNLFPCSIVGLVHYRPNS